MVHAPVSFVAGQAADLRRHADELERIMSRFAAILCERTGQPAQVVSRWLGLEDTWFTADEALAAGLVADVIHAPPEIRRVEPSDTEG